MEAVTHFCKVCARLVHPPQQRQAVFCSSNISELEDILTRGKESDTYLTTASRHCWSRQMTMKTDKM